jgi:two-component system copper resistance phosphate regulon response regulator CusR
MDSPTSSHDVTPHLLVVEDDEKTCRALVDGFISEGWTVASAKNAAEANRQLATGIFSLIVLDWNLPDAAGTEVLRRQRTAGLQTPVLILTARGSIQDRVSGLEQGADDYLMKPFSFEELAARCRSLMRRSALHPGRGFSSGDLEVDLLRRTARVAENLIQLTPREIDILEYLFRHHRKIVTREMLARDIWKQSRRFTSIDNVIDVQMLRLRRKLAAGSEGAIIHTIRGVGYRLGKSSE